MRGELVAECELVERGLRAENLVPEHLCGLVGISAGATFGAAAALELARVIAKHQLTWHRKLILSCLARKDDRLVRLRLGPHDGE